MGTPVVSVVFGKDLSSEDLQIINASRKQEFNSQTPIAPIPDDENWNKPYFLVRDGNELVAFGRLHEVDVQFQNEQHSVLGIATIVALKKGEGYGKKLMQKMKEYIENTGKTAIGFCSSSMSGFYEKSGYGILKDSVKRFVYQDDSGRLPSAMGEDVIYIEGADGLIAKMTVSSNDKIIARRAPW